MGYTRDWKKEFIFQYVNLESKYFEIYSSIYIMEWLSICPHTSEATAVYPRSQDISMWALPQHSHEFISFLTA